MPLSEPTDTNPIVKEPPVFQDGVASPNNSLSTAVDIVAATTDIDSFAFDPETNEVFVANFDSFNVLVLDGYSSDVKRQYTTTDFPASMSFFDGHLYITNSTSDTVVKVDPSDGTAVETVDFGHRVDALTFDSDGNIYVTNRQSATDNRIEKHNGFANDLDSFIDYSSINGGDNQFEDIAFFNDFLCISSVDDSPEAWIYVFEGFSVTEERHFSTTDLMGRSTKIEQVNDKLGGAEGRDSVIFTLANADNGENFIGNSGKVLETGKIYSLEIQGPNSVVDPTINDDGQGQFGIVLPGGASVPVGTLSGALDFLFDGSNYVLQTITRGLAQSIYMDEQDALTAQDTATVDNTYGSEEAGVIENNRTRIAEIQSALQNNGILPTP